jgi:hypothetical protein
MARQAEIDKRKAILTARGVPERFIDAIARRNSIPAFLITLFIAAAVFAAVVMALMALSASIEAWLAPRFYAAALDSLIFYMPSAPVMLLFLAAMTLWLLSFPVTLAMAFRRQSSPSPAYHGLAVTLRTLRPGETLATVKADETYAALSGLADDQAFLNAVRPPNTKPVVNILVSLVVLIPVAVNLVGTLADAGKFRDVTLDAVRLHDHGRVTLYPLAKADYAEARCDAKHGFDYRLHFPGQTVSLWTYRDPLHRLDDVQILDRLTRVDDRLISLHVPIRRLPATGDAKSCVEKTVQRWKLTDGQPLERLVFGN